MRLDTTTTPLRTLQRWAKLMGCKWGRRGDGAAGSALGDSTGQGSVLPPDRHAGQETPTDARCGPSQWNLVTRSL